MSSLSKGLPSPDGNLARLAAFDTHSGLLCQSLVSPINSPSLLREMTLTDRVKMTEFFCFFSAFLDFGSFGQN